MLSCLVLWHFGCSKASNGVTDSARRRATLVTMTNYVRAVERLAEDCGPEVITASNVTAALLSNPGWGGWRGPYIDSEMVSSRGVGDFWYRGMDISIADGRLRITSSGPDGLFGNGDDFSLDAVLHGKVERQF